MNILIKPIHFVCVVLLLVGLNFQVHGQTIEQDTLNGEVYYVYPFNAKVSIHSAYYFAARKVRVKGPRYTFKQYYREMFGDNYNKREFRQARREIYAQAFLNRRFNRKPSYLNNKFKKAVRKNPYPLMEPNYSLEQDVTPSLDPIPDGKYVQYFDMFYHMNDKGKRVNFEKRVSGIFTIKDNVLDGEAIWLNFQGDTLKMGKFERGAKVGEWRLETRKVEYTISKTSAALYCERGYPETDTTIEFVTYTNGFMNGPYKYFANSAYPIQEGFFKDGEPSGEWLQRDIKFIREKGVKVRDRNNSVITWTYTPASTKVPVHQTLIRNKLIRDENYSNQYNFESKYAPSISFSKMYSLYYPEEPEIELDEEKINSYEGEVYEDELYGEEGYIDEQEYYSEDEYNENSSFRHTTYDRNSGKYLSTAKLRDSLGVVFQFEGVFEKRYPNGQLMVHYEVKDGKLVEEDTIYWDNGKPYDVVSYIPDSNQYIHAVYDYYGKLFNEIVYDSIGEFVRVNFQPETMRYVLIDGYRAEDRDGAKYYFYDKLDSLSTLKEDSTVIFRSWYKADSSMLYTRSFNLKERELFYTLFSASGKPSVEAYLLFGENYESWTGTSTYTLGEVSLHTTSSASFSEYMEKDSVAINHINDYDRNFDVTEEHVFMVEDKPFTGDVSITVNEKDFKLNVGKEVKIILPRGLEMTEKLEKEISAFRKTGKSKYDDLLNTIDASEIDEDFGSGIFGSLFGPFIGNFVDYPYSGYYDEYDYEQKKYKERKDSPFSKQITGYMLDGKPHGIWIIRDQFGNILVEVPFEKGVLNGKVKEYDNLDPREMRYNFEGPEEFRDSIPRRKTHYLYSTKEFKNGYANGEYAQYDWLGQLVAQEYFKDGYKDGPAFERNKLAYTSLNYSEGALDGYVRTYLTMNAQDSILLFDLNFQNGLLQGESRSYHTNGKLAKRGFFLNGDPIDDYEAYDSLGFKYHYVKFLYSFPVEEKIWEENQLSVRYQFDWRDSIYFEPKDITSTQSLDRVLANLGIGREYYERPYYGRPSIVNKTGIDYHMTKYYPNDSIARDGSIRAGKKVGCWKFYDYQGQFLYEVDYFDTIIQLNDTIQFKAKGILTDYDASGNKLSESFIIEKFEKYDCSHTDHYEIRQLLTIWEANDTLHRMNGYVKNYYDNGVLQSEGTMKNGLPDGVWKFYDPYGKLNQVGAYVLGKRDGRWLGGDLSKTKYLGDICLNPNLPNLEEEIKYRENLLDIVITNYKMGKALNKEFYDINMNNLGEENEEIIDGELMR